MTEAENLLKRHDAMVRERALIEPFYECAALYFDPLRKYHWSGQQTGQSSRSVNWNGDLFSSAGLVSLNRFTYFLMGNATPASSRWFHAQDSNIAELDAESADFYSYVTKTISQELRGSSSRGETFYQSRGRAYRDMAISYGVTWVYEGQKESGLEGEVIHRHVPSHKFYYQFDAWGHIASCSLVWRMTPAEAMSIFGRNIDDAETEEQRARKSNDQLTVVQMVLKNTPDKAKVNPRKFDEFPYMEYWIDERDKKIIMRRGLRSQPFHVDGWHRVPDSSYFVGPIYDALPDMVTAAAAKRSYLAGLQWAGEPTFLGGQKIAGATRNLKPKRVLWNAIDHQGRQKIQPIQTGHNPSQMAQGVFDMESGVRSLLGNDEMVNNITKNMTAQEAFQRSQERAAMVAPFIQNVIPSISGQLTRHFEIKLRAGAYPEVPAQVQQEGSFDIEIIGPLAMSARQTEIGSMMQAIEQSAVLEQMQSRLIDTRDAVKTVMQNAGHAELVRDFAEVDREIAQEEEAFRQQQEAAAGQQEAMAAKTGMEAVQLAGDVAGQEEVLQ